MKVDITKEVFNDFCPESQSNTLKEYNRSSEDVKRVEVIDTKNGHRFIFTQQEDNGVTLKILPYNNVKE